MEKLAKLADTEFEESSARAFRWGYEDGLYEDPAESFTENLRLASLEDSEVRLEYYRGHRRGSSSRSDGVDRAA